MSHDLPFSNLSLVLLDVLFLCAEAHVFYRHCASLHDSCMVVQAWQLVDPLHLCLYLLGKLLFNLLLMLNLFLLLLHLSIIKGLHLFALRRDFGTALLVFDMWCDDILQRKHVPCVVLFWFDVTWFPRLETCFDRIQTLVRWTVIRPWSFKHRTSMHLLVVMRWHFLKRWRWTF